MTVLHISGSVPIEYNCAGCGHYAVAYVQAAGVGNLSSLQGEDAGFAAADQDLYTNAYRVVQCVACPACKYVDYGHRQSLLTKAVMWALFPVVCLLGVAWWSMGSSTTSMQALGVIGAGLFVIASLPTFFVLRHKWWANAEDRVVFDDDEHALDA